MTTTVRLDDEIASTLNKVCNTLHKKKSDVIREAILFYAGSLENKKRSRLQKAIEKTAEKDHDEYLTMEETLNDGL